MATLKPIPPYRLAAIYATSILPIEGSNMKYSDAYTHAVNLMKIDEQIVHVLIYSQNTAIVLKRKWIAEKV